MPVIGPDSNEQVMMDTIIDGVRADLKTGAASCGGREALDVVISGSNPGLHVSCCRSLSTAYFLVRYASVTSWRPHLTVCEGQRFAVAAVARSIAR